MTKFLYTLILGLITSSFFAQDFTNQSNQWTAHYSYLQISDVAQSKTKIYGAAENAVFSYDVDSKTTEKLSTVNGLSGETISALYYSENFEALVIGYENGIIEIVFDKDNEVFTAIDIAVKTNIGDEERRINHFVESEGTLYVSTNFGIIEFDFSKLEFGDTFFIGTNNSKIAVAQTAIFEGSIFAATEANGIFKAAQNNSNLIDATEWNVIQLGAYIGIQFFGNKLYAFDVENRILNYNGTSFVPQINLPAKIEALKSNETYLTVTLRNNVFTYDSSLKQVSNISRNNAATPLGFSSGISFGDQVYVGTRSSGLFKTGFNKNETIEVLSPDGPLLNIPRALDVYEGELWVTYGQYSNSYAPAGDGRGISHFSKVSNVWNNIPFGKLKGAISIADVAINPSNPNQVFFGSHQRGLLEVVNDEVVELYNHINTDNVAKTLDPENRLETVDPNATIVRIHSLDFDSNGDLWLTNGLINRTALKKFSPVTKKITSVDLGSVLPDFASTRFSDALITDNAIFLGSFRDGVIGHNLDSNSNKKIVAGLEENDIRALALDTNDKLWVGSIRGLRILSNVSSVFQQENPVLSDIIISEDGINQQVLSDQFIWDIKVDGSNNKWIATENSGVFYLSPNGEQTLAHFTKENSPLPSNFVQDITIDGSTGAVYFATTKGLLEFRGTATEANETLDKLRAFPNPVRPGYAKMVTVDGLTKGANVKITDIEGNLVFEASSDGGSVQWDTRAFGKHKVASGVYLILVTAEEQVETKVAKLMIVR